MVTTTTGNTDALGSPLGTDRAKANAVLTGTPKKMKQIVAEAGLEHTCYNHLNALVERGVVAKSDAGYFIPSGTPPAQDNAQEDEQESATEFALEADLRNFLAKNLHVIEAGLALYRDSVTGTGGVEFQVGGRRIDILAVTADGQFVVIELKVSRGYDRVVGQLMRYMAWVRQNMAKPGQAVRGVIVAREITDDLKLACSELPPVVQLFEYEMSVKLKPAPLKAGT